MRTNSALSIKFPFASPNGNNFLPFLLYCLNSPND